VSTALQSVLGEEVGMTYRVSIQLIAYVHPSAIPLELGSSHQLPDQERKRREGGNRSASHSGLAWEEGRY
jgi:hypothetical protein